MFFFNLFFWDDKCNGHHLWLQVNKDNKTVYYKCSRKNCGATKKYLNLENVGPLKG